MALQVESGSFAASTSGATTTWNSSFQGKALILWANSSTDSGGTDQAGAAFSMGFSDGTNHRTHGWAADDAVATSNAGQSYNTRALEIFSNGTPTIVRFVSGVAFNATNFVLTFDGTPAAAYNINYILFGGADLTNAFVGNDTWKTTTGTKATTGVGFPGDFFFFLTNRKTAAGTGVDAAFGFGCAANSTTRWGMGCGVRDAQTLSANVNGMSDIDNTKCLIGYNPTDQTLKLADFVSSDSDGFTLNFTAAPGSAFIFSYLVIKGGQWACGTQAKPTTATTQSVTGQAFQPKVLGVTITSATALATATSVAHAIHGAAVSTSARSYGAGYHNDAINTVAKSHANSAALLREHDTSAAMDFTSFDSGGWTGTWNATGTAYQVGWWAATDNVGGGASDSVMPPAAQGGIIPYRYSRMTAY